MKKIFFGISMMLLSALSFSAAAQTQEAQQQCNNENCKQEQCEKKCDKKGDCDKAKKCDKKRDCDKQGVCDKAAKKACKGDSVCKGARKGRPMGIEGKRPEGMRHGKQLGRFDGQRGGRERLFEGIELTDQQKAQIEALDKKMIEERKALKDDSAVKTDEARKEARKAGEEARKAYNLAIKEILTTEQYTKYEANRDAMKLRHDGKRDFRLIKDDVRKANIEKVKKADK